MVESSDGFCREAFGIPVPLGARCLVAGVDLVRDGDGTYRVLEDNLRNPSGITYVIENRVAMTRVLPTVFADQQIRPVDHYGRSLLNALHRVAPAGVERPADRRGAHARACSTPPTSSTCSSPRRWASSWSRAATSSSTTTSCRCAPPRACSASTSSTAASTTTSSTRSPFRADSTLGVPGLMAAARAGNVTIANAVGNGVADDKAVYAYVPDFIRYYLGEEPILPNVATYLLWDDDQRDRRARAGSTSSWSSRWPRPAATAS